METIVVRVWGGTEKDVDDQFNVSFGIILFGLRTFVSVQFRIQLDWSSFHKKIMCGPGPCLGNSSRW